MAALRHASRRNSDAAGDARHEAVRIRTPSMVSRWALVCLSLQPGRSAAPQWRSSFMRFALMALTCGGLRTIRRMTALLTGRLSLLVRSYSNRLRYLYQFNH